MKKMTRPVICVFLLALVVLLGGCMKMHIDIVWNEDNSASISLTVGVTNVALSMMDTSEAEMQQQLREGFEEDPGVDYTIENFSDAEYTGIVVIYKVDDITRRTPESLEHLDFFCEDDGGTLVYTVLGDFMDSDVLGEGETDGIDVDTQISIVMPGRIVSHNATSKSGNKLTWVIEGSDAMTIYASSESGGGLLWLWIVIGAVVVLGGAAGAFLFLRKKKSASKGGQFAPGMDAAQGPGAHGHAPYQQPQQPVYQQPQPPVYEQPQPPVYEQPQPPVYEQPQPPVYEQPQPPI